MADELTTELVLSDVRKAIRNHYKKTEGIAPKFLYLGQAEYRALYIMRDWFLHWDYEHKTFEGVPVFRVAEHRHLNVF